MSHDPTVIRYSQSSGLLDYPAAPDNRRVLARGYSGYMDFANRQEFEALRGKGPIPRGLWEVGVPYKHARLGPLAFPLNPKGHTALGRTAFFIHGDNRRGDRSGSYGCIVMPRNVRSRLADLRAQRRLVLHVED